MSWLRETLRILRTAGLPAMVALIVSSIIDQFINTRLETLLTSDDGGGASLWILAGSSLLNGLLFPIIVTAVVLHGLLRARGFNESYGTFIGRTIRQLYIETLRAWGSAMRWGLLLVVPGVIRLLQLIFVPFVVCFHAPYERGDVDALKTSSQYWRRRIWSTLGIVALFHLILPLATTDLLDPWRTFETTPLAAIACVALDLILTIVSLQLLFRVFESARRELGDESLLRTP